MLKTIARPQTLEPQTAKLDFLWLELTQKCNLTCDHCYVSSGPHLPLTDRMNHSHWIVAIDDAAELGCRAIQFIGGEPLLYRRIAELIGHAKEAGFSFIEVFTNGTPVTAAKAEMLATHGVHVATSVYSDDGAVHDAITGKPGSFERTIQALRDLVARAVPVRAGFIEMEVNKGQYQRTRSMLERLGVTQVGCDKVRDFGRGSDEVSLDRPDLFSDSPYAGLCGQCARGRLCVTYDGTAYPCIMSRTHTVGNVIDQGLRGILESSVIGNFRTGMMAVAKQRIEQGCVPLEPPESGSCTPPDPCMVCGPGVCVPDRQCGPDFSPCPPEVCTPQIAIAPAGLQETGCTPLGPCMVCGPGPGPCTPDGPCSPGICQPDFPCWPDSVCAPPPVPT